MAETEPEVPEVEPVEDHPYPKALQLYPTVRQSRLATFDQCTLLSKFDEEYRQGWSSHPASRGQIFHRFAAKALKEMQDNEEGTLDASIGLDILRECLRQHDVPDEDVVTIPFSSIKDLRWVVVKFCHDNMFDIQYLASIEERLEAIVHYETEYGPKPRRLTGQLDAVFFPQPDWAVVIDWKDTWALPAKGNQDENRSQALSEEGYFQQRFYAFLVMRRYPGVKRVTLREQYVRYSEAREATLFRSELANIEEELTALVERFDRAHEHGKWPLPQLHGEMKAAERKAVQKELRENLWKPSPGAHCSFCPRPGICPIFPDARVEGAITNAEMAETWAAEQIVAKATVSQRDKALRAWASVQGPVPIKHAKDPNRVLGYRESKRTSRPTKEQLEEAMREQGADFDPESVYRTTKQSRFEPHTAPVTDEPVDADLHTALEESLRRAGH